MRVLKFFLPVACATLVSIPASAQVANLLAGYQQARSGLTAEPMKCGFAAQTELRNAPGLEVELRKSMLARPVLPQAYVTPDKRFRIHYTTSGVDAVASTSTNSEGVPDFVYEAGKAAQRAYALLVDSLGMKSHAPDGGVDGSEFDFYIINLGSLYGETRFEFSGGSGPAYIVIDNNYGPEFYSQGLNGLRVTVAHEYFHAVQLNYFLRNEDIFFFEISSVWFEDVAYDEVNDYFAYLRRWFRDTELPLTTRNGSHEYGSGLWLHYITQKIKSRTIVRDFWERIVQEPAMLAMKNRLQAAPYELPFGLAVSEFYTWCFFTGARALPEFYFAEGEDYPSIEFAVSQQLTQNLTLTDDVEPLAAKYYRLIRVAQDLQGNLQIAEDPGRFSLTSISRDDDGEYFSQTGFGQFPVVVAAKARQDTVVFVAVNGSLPQTSSGGNSYNLQLTLGPQLGLENMLESPYPNPFRPPRDSFLRVPYSIKKAAVVEAIILAEDGRVMWRTKSSQNVPVGLHEIVWNGRDEAEQLVASGVYILRFIAGDFAASTKIVVIRR